MFFFHSLFCTSKAMSRYIKSCMCIWCETIWNYEGNNRSAVRLWKESLEEDVTYPIEHYRWCTLNIACVCVCLCKTLFKSKMYIEKFLQMAHMNPVLWLRTTELLKEEASSVCGWPLESRVWLMASSEALCRNSRLCPHPGSQRNSIQNTQLKVMSCNCLSLHDSAAQHLCQPSRPLSHPNPPPVFPFLLPEEQLVSTLENGEMPLQKNHHPFVDRLFLGFQPQDAQ